MDIYSKGEYPSCALSNFAEYDFNVDGVPCKSMEGFLQSLKYRSQRKQRDICLLSGKEAKLRGKYKFIWKITGNTWWRGQKIKRCSNDFKLLIDKAYDSLFKNEAFRRALIKSGAEELTHSIGSHNPKRTILTEEEFISELERLRKGLKEQA